MSVPWGTMTEEDYWRYQKPIGELGGVLNRWKFARFVGPEDKLVDFGCGGGFLLGQLNARSKIGIEINPFARSHAEALGLDVRSSLGEIEPDWADVVVSNHALEHTACPLQIVRQVNVVLRPGGHLILWLPLDDWRAQRHVDQSDINRHLHAWTPQLLHNLLTEAGFNVDKCRVVTHAWPPSVRRFVNHPRLFRVSGAIWAVLRRRRQLFALARKPLS